MSIHVQTDFPGGNACAVETRVEGDTDVIRFAASPHGGIEALWFFLRVVECSDRPVDLELTNVDSLLGNAQQWEHVRPVVRVAGGAWERCDPPRIRVRGDGVREAIWRVEPRVDSFEFALCYPYALGEVEVLRATSRGYWNMDVVGVTALGRRLPRLSNAYGADGCTLPGVYLMARQHAGETPGSWVLDGLLRHAADTVAPDDLVLWSTPLLNLDGVMRGDYGKDPFPYDLNRAWSDPPMRHEVLVALRDLRRWASRCRPALVVDLHAPSATEAEGAYFFIPRASRPSEHVAAVRQAVEAVVPHMPPELMRSDPVIQPSYPSRWDPEAVVGVRVWEVFGIPTLTLETPYSASHDRVLARADYQELGACLLRGIHAYCGPQAH